MTLNYEIPLAGGSITLETGKLAQQANGAVVVKQGDTVLLATACGAKEAKEGMDFLPLSVDVAEKFYAIGKLPGGFFKREGRPNTEAILSARLCDRPLRPLFPADYHNETQVIITLLSGDKVHPYSALGIVGASAALTISDIPFDNPIGACVIGLVDGELIVNPTYLQLKEGELELTVAGTGDAIMMVEAGSNMVSEEILLDALQLAQKTNGQIVSVIKQMQDECGKSKWGLPETDPKVLAVENEIREKVGSLIKDAILAPGDKGAKRSAVKEAMLRAEEKMTDIDHGIVKDVLHKLEKEAVRECILESKVRPDGRQLDEIRPLSSETGLLPRAHGSALFTRGETQILNAVTLAPTRESQKIDGFGLDTERFFIHHYNFPPYSTGEAGRFGFTGRREVGHGALAERALASSMPTLVDFPYTVRSVSEALSSNGSTSMASVCSGSLALMDAGVPVKSAVAGIAMGLITGDSGEYAVLTDIQGTEDHSGDMDFKVAGTRDGVTALQMDIKVTGISFEVMREALEQARRARLEILDHMAQTIAEPRSSISEYAPRISTITIPTDKIGAVIGTGGSVIRGLMEQFSVSIDVEDDGTVTIGSTDEDAAAKAKIAITTLVGNVEIGQKFRAKVSRTMSFGAFVEIAPGKEGLVHISELSTERVPSVEDVVSIGDELDVVVVNVDDMGRIDFSVRALLEENEAARTGDGTDTSFVGEDSPAVKRHMLRREGARSRNSGGDRDRRDSGGRGDRDRRDSGGRGDRDRRDSGGRDSGGRGGWGGGREGGREGGDNRPPRQHPAGRRSVGGSRGSDRPKPPSW